MTNNTAGTSPVFCQNKRCRLPNGLDIVYQTKSEVAHFYHDIFERKIYLQSGISLKEGGCVFDVGANIGLFSLFVSCCYGDIRVYAFEPAPPLFAVLQANLEEHARNARLFNCGLSNRNKRAAFTFYPNSSGMSSFYADLDQEKQALKTILEAEMRSGKEGIADLMAYSEEFLDERFKMESYECSLRRLSDVIREHEVERIDLLKIDVQKSEMDVLEGIDEEDWGKIEQIVLEVHDFECRLEKVDAILREKNYRTRIVQDYLYRGSPIFNIYGIKDVAEESKTGDPVSEQRADKKLAAIRSRAELQREASASRKRPARGRFNE